MATPKYDFEGLPARLMQARKQAKVAREKLGEMMGVSRQAVARWEYPVTHPRNSVPQLSDIARIATYLRSDFLWLATGITFVEASKEDSGQLLPVFELQTFHAGGPPLFYKRSSAQVKKAAWFRIEDADNSPEYLPGEFCLMETQLGPQPGKMVIARLSGKGRNRNVFRQYTVSGIGSMGDPVVLLRPLNPATPSFSSTEEKFDIQAVLVEHVKDMTRR
jgi:transcriptional regulator with XRE-family HTH domain